MTHPTPVEMAERQLQAYNARDIDAFVACYAEDVTCYLQGADEPFLSGRAALRTRYGALFEKCPALHARLVQRLSCGNIVMDEEQVSGMRADERVHAIAIYEVLEGLIRRVWFVRDP